MKYFKQLDFQIYDLQSELNKLFELKKIQWSKDSQICLNNIKGHEDDALYGVGCLELDWEKATNYTDDAGNIKLHVPDREIPLHEEDFTILSSVFKDTLFEDVYNMLSSKFKLGRIRIIQNHPGRCTSWHTDCSKRIHYPIKTDPACKMVINDEVFHMPENTWWETDTTYHHSAFNGSRVNRIHIVGVILDN